MCGCGSVAGSSSGSKGTSTACYGRVSDLHIIRNSLITLERVTKDPAKKIEYKELRTQVEVMLKDSATTCPDLATIIALKTFIANQ